MALNEKDRLKVLEIMKRIDVLEEWVRWCMDELHKENAKLMDAWRDSD